MQALQRTLGDPEILLGAVRSPAQEALQPQLDAALAAVVGYVDYVVDAVTSRLIGGDANRIAEAVRRRRIEASPEDVFVERLLGLHLSRQQVERGRAFIEGVHQRGGQAAVNLLLEQPGPLPTPAELDAPGLWLARLEAPGDRRTLGLLLGARSRAGSGGGKASDTSQRRSVSTGFAAADFVCQMATSPTVQRSGQRPARPAPAARPDDTTPWQRRRSRQRSQSQPHLAG